MWNMALFVYIERGFWDLTLYDLTFYYDEDTIRHEFKRHRGKYLLVLKYR